MFYKIRKHKGNCNIKTFVSERKTSNVDMRDLLCHKLERKVILEKLLKMLKKTVAKLPVKTISEGVHF